MILKKLNHKRAHLIILILALIILSIPPIVRIINYESNPIGSLSYYDMRISSQINQKGHISYDELAYAGSNYSIDAYHHILAFFSNLLPTVLIIFLLPIILGLLSVHIFYLLIRKLTKKKSIANLSTLIYILSPIFVYLFCFPNHHYIPVLINLIIAFLLISEKKKVISFLLCLLVPLFGIKHTMVLLAIFIVLAFYKKKQRKQILWHSILLIVSALFYYVPIYLMYGIQKTQTIEKINLFNSFVSDFGALVSFSIFFIMLSLMSLFLIEKEHDSLAIYIGALIILILSYYITELRFYLNFILVIIVTIALIKIIKRKWKLPGLKNIAILAIICGLIFTSISYIDRISNFEPHQNKINALEWLEEQPQGTVISHYSNGYLIETIANKKTFLNPSLNHPETVQRKLDSDIIFYSHHLSDTTEKLEKYNIKYIFIDQSMKNGEVWEKENQGLLLILEESGLFRKIYSLDNIEIWTYLQK
jgi:hypothetical protein